MPRARRYLLLALSALFALACLRLGLWQLARLGERRRTNAAAVAQRRLPVVELSGSVIASLDNRRVRVWGHYDREHPVVLRHFLYRGAPGVRVAMPLRPVAGDSALMVLRGFIPAADGMTVDLRHLQDTALALVEGVAQPIPTTEDSGGPLTDRGTATWRRLDLAALRGRLPYPLRAVYVIQERAEETGGTVFRLEPPALDDGPHLSYALQWFGFGITALVVAAIVARRT